MVGEVSDAAAAPAWWQQIGTFAGIGAAVLFAAVQAFRQGRGEHPPAPGHVVLEQAEIADVNVFRQLLQRYDAMLAVSADVAELKKKQNEMLAILERMDRQEEIRGILREQRRRDDESK